MLSEADEKRGMTGSVLAMVAGLLNVNYREPRKLGGMPTLNLSFFVLTMDGAGHIVWPTNFEPSTRAALRKLARRELAVMLADPLYPASPAMAAALTQAGESYLSLGSIAAVVAARKSALAVERLRLRALRIAAAANTGGN